jgi:hypothetical protein
MPSCDAGPMGPVAQQFRRGTPPAEVWKTESLPTVSTVLRCFVLTVNFYLSDYLTKVGGGPGMATSGSLPFKAWTWRESYVAALMEPDNEKMSARIADAERVIVERAKELFNQSGDNIQEEEAMDDALYALRALKACIEHGGFAVA